MLQIALGILQRIPLLALDENDGSELTGKTFTGAEMQASKNGAAFANAAGAVTEVGLGTYYYTPVAADVNTVGYLEVRFTNAGMKTFYALVQVGGIWEPNLEGGLTAKQIMRLLVASQAGEVQDAETATPDIKAAGNNTKQRITATTDADGNRNAITLDVTDI